jgi:hypothetical protein
MRERAPFARALAVVAGQAQDLESSGEAIVSKPAAHATRPGIPAACAEPPPRPPNRSRRTASRGGRSPTPLGQRAGGLRCSRLHSGACSHSPHRRKHGAACRIRHSSPEHRTWLPLPHRPASAGRCGLPGRAGRSWLPIRADAVSAGCARHRRRR